MLERTMLLFSAERPKPPSDQFQSFELTEAAIIGLLGYLFGFKGFVTMLLSDNAFSLTVYLYLFSLDKS